MLMGLVSSADAQCYGVALPGSLWDIHGHKLGRRSKIVFYITTQGAGTPSRGPKSLKVSEFKGLRF